MIIGHLIYKLGLKFLDVEAANCGREVPKNWTKFDIQYLDNTTASTNTAADVHALLTRMSNNTPLDELYPLMIKEPAHPIKPVSSYLRSKQTAVKTDKVARIIIFDLETTGLIIEGQPMPRIVEISAYDPARDEWFTRLVNPEMPIPEQASRIHGISDAMVMKADKISKVIADFSKWVGNSAVLCGWNTYKYDFPVLKADARRGGFQVPYSWIPFCFYVLAFTLRIPKLPDLKLQTLRRNYRIAPTQAHRAQGDTEVTYKVMLKLINNADINAVYKEMATHGEFPVKRVAKIIMDAGGPAPFEAPEESEDSRPIVREAPVGRIKVPVCDTGSTSEAEPTPPVKRKRRFVTPRPAALPASRTMAETNLLAIRIAAKMAIEMATMLDEPALPAAPAHTAKRRLVRRELSPDSDYEDEGITLGSSDTEVMDEEKDDDSSTIEIM